MIEQMKAQLQFMMVSNLFSKEDSDEDGLGIL